MLGRKEFKLLLKWRMKVREVFGFPSKKSKAALSEEVAVVEPMDEEMQIQEDLQKMKEKESSKKKRERRRDNEKKTKDIIRMQMNMTAPMDIGMEQDGPRGEGAMFKLKTIDQGSVMNRIAKGKMVVVSEADEKRERERDSGLGSSGETDDESDEDGDALETELDELYDQYRERKAESDAKYRAKKARQEHEDDEWEGVSADEKDSDDDEELEGFEEESSGDEDDAEDGAKPLITDLDDTPSEANGLSKRAAGFFKQDIFNSIQGILDSDDEEMEDEVKETVVEAKTKTKETKETKKTKKEKAAPKQTDAEESDDGGFEVVKNTRNVDDDWEEHEKRTKDGRPSKFFVFQSITTPTNLPRHRHHHGRSHDARAPARLGRSHVVRHGRRRLQQARLQGPRRAARLVPRRRGQARPAAQAHHQGGGRRHQGEAAGVQRAADQEGGRGARAQEVQAGAEAREAQEEGGHCSGRRGPVGEGQGQQHRKDDCRGGPQEEARADKGGQGGGVQQGYQWAAEGCQGPVQDGGSADEEGGAGAQEGGQGEEEVVPCRGGGMYNLARVGTCNQGDLERLLSGISLAGLDGDAFLQCLSCDTVNEGRRWLGTLSTLCCQA